MDRWKFFKENGEMRARLVNPPLIIANPKGRKKNPMPKTITMTRNRKGQFVRSRSSNPPKKHHKKTAGRRKNWFGAGAAIPGSILMNPRGKTKKRRHNPPDKIAGIPVPNMEETVMLAGGVTLGLGGPPIIRGLIRGMLPVGTLPPVAPPSGPTAPATTSQTIAGYALSAASYGLPLGLGYMIGGRKGLKYVAAGELASVLVQLLNSAAASISSSLGPSVSGYVRRPLAAYTAPLRLNGYTAPARTIGRNVAAFPSTRSNSRMSRFDSPRR